MAGHDGSKPNGNADPAPPVKTAAAVDELVRDPLAIRRLFESEEYPCKTAMPTRL